MEHQLIYGRRPVAEAERGGGACTASGGAPQTSAAELERKCGSHVHQGVVAEVDPYPTPTPVIWCEEETF